MNLRNCIRCRKLFLIVAGSRICPECVQLEEEEYQKVRDYVNRYPKAMVMQVARATGVSVPKITRFIRDGRLIVTHPEDGIRCESCSRPITKGRMCPKCIERFRRNLHGEPSPASLPPKDPVQKIEPGEQKTRRVIRDFRGRWS